MVRLPAILVLVGLTTCCIAQSPDRLFDAFRREDFNEKLFVHIDRPSYLAGEIAWFRLACIDAAYHKPSSLSRVAYLEVLDGAGHALVQTKTILDSNGYGDGSLILPLSMTTGSYTLRAYTNWMKNGSPDLYFRQVIFVVNPFMQASVSSGSARTEIDAQFFPEGGNLVAGLQCTMGFRIVAPDGHGLDCSGAIINQANDTITRFSSLRFGIGRTTFTPAADQIYRAVIIDRSGKKSTYPLPAVRATGFSITLSETDERILVAVRSTDNDSKPITMIGHCRETHLVIDTQTLRSREAVFTLNKSFLAEGITHLIFLDGQLPIGERLYFKAPKAVTQNIVTESQYTQRQPVKITAPAGFRWSASIYKEDTGVQEPMDVTSWLFLTSDLRGRVESPAFYLDPSQQEARDNLMLTHGWTRLTWSDVISKRAAPKFVPETHAHLITGTITEAGSKKPVVGMPVFVTSTGVYSRPYAALSHSDGSFTIESQHLFGLNELVAQTNTGRDSLYKIEFNSPYSSAVSTESLPLLVLDGPQRKDLEERSIHLQVQNVFYKKERSTFKKPEFDSVSFYGSADSKYLLDDYTRFPTMEEVMREYVGGVQVRRPHGNFRLMNFDQVARTYFVSNPFTLIDGVPVFDMDKLMALDPHRIKSVEVLNRRFYLGVSSLEGILSFRTYAGDLGGYQLPTGTVVTTYDGMQMSREFFAPVYESSADVESPLPDTRHLLYWAPSIDASGSTQTIQFTTSDISGKFRIVLQGLSADGTSSFATGTFQVK